MVYLSSFSLPSNGEEDLFLSSPKGNRSGQASRYPFLLFRGREISTFDFSEVTIFTGDNGSGKSTLLNLIAEKLHLSRRTAFNRTDFFADFVSLCEATLDARIPRESCVITSDDVFDRVLTIRRLNDGIDDRRGALTEEYLDERSRALAGEPNLLSGLDDYDRWRNAREMRTVSRTSFLRSRLIRNLEERSNGESALSVFVDGISDRALYLLDEPENSLSPQNQLQLKYFIEDAAASLGCQFLISTHSPFLLSLRHARIYDLDTTPPSLARFDDLASVRAYRELFDGLL